MLEGNGFGLRSAVDELHKFKGKGMLRYPLGRILLVLFHKPSNICEGQEGEHLQIALDGVIGGSYEELKQSVSKIRVFTCPGGQHEPDTAQT